MSAYNSVNSEWCGQHTHLLTDILRDEWGWDGFVTSDFIFGLRDPALSVRAGLDIEMPFRQQRAMALDAALERGELSEADVDRSVERIVATLLRFASVFERQPPPEVVGGDDHRRLAREVAAASTVLLRNEGALLPIDVPDGGRIAVLGRLAAVRNLGDGGSSDVRASRVVTALDGLRTRYGADRVVHHDDEVSIAAGADVVVVVVGYTKADEGECIEAAGTDALGRDIFPPIDHPELGNGAPWEPPAVPIRPPAAPSDAHDGTAGDANTERMAPGGDRTSLRLSDADEALIGAAAAAHDRVIVVVVAGSAVVMPWASTVSAVLLTWYSGVEGGTALADVLGGDVEPEGRLPFVVPTEPSHLPHFDRDATSVTYDLFHGQWLLDRDGHDAHFPFGWGLGWGAVDVVGAHLVDGSTVVATVHNPGSRSLRPVVFVHAGVTSSAWERPRRRLVGFGRTTVEPGATVTLDIDLDWSMLDVRVDGDWVTEAGAYELDVGLHARDPDAVALTVQR
jgi:hypothetical protein